MLLPQLTLGSPNQTAAFFARACAALEAPIVSSTQLNALRLSLSLLCVAPARALSFERSVCAHATFAGPTFAFCSLSRAHGSAQSHSRVLCFSPRRLQLAGYRSGLAARANGGGGRRQNASQRATAAKAAKKNWSTVITYTCLTQIGKFPTLCGYKSRAEASRRENKKTNVLLTRRRRRRLGNGAGCLWGRLQLGFIIGQCC